MNWYIGQSVVCVKIPNDNFLGIKINSVHTIRAIRSCPCSCDDGALLDVGFNIPLKCQRDKMLCADCGEIFKTLGEYWINERCFAPLDELADITELTEVLENTKPFEVK